MEKNQNTWYGKTSQEHSAATKEGTSAQSLRTSQKSRIRKRQSLFLKNGNGQETLWEMDIQLLGESWTHNFGESPKDARESSLSQVLMTNVPEKYCLTPKACLGILRRTSERGKRLPKLMEEALMRQAKIMSLYH